jgi:hypothetical protein
VVGKHTVAEAPVAIVHLPRVEVVGHRAEAGVQTAQAANCGATTVC